MSLIVERVSEGTWVPPWIRYQHLERYHWVAQWTERRRVIDAACGTGYGSALLAQQGAQVVFGLDLSEEAINEARRLYQVNNLHFEVADVTRLPIEDEAYDVFVSFETIEHIDNVDQFLSEVVRVLKPGGRFICSTPNRTLTNAGTRIHDRPFNMYHLREYTSKELETSLSRYFPSVRLVGQSIYASWYARMLNGIGRSFPMLAVRLHQVRKVLGIPWEKPECHHPTPWSAGSEPESLIAICESPHAFVSSDETAR